MISLQAQQIALVPPMPKPVVLSPQREKERWKKAVQKDMAKLQEEAIIVVWLFIKTSQINDKARNYMLSSDSLIRSIYSWQTPRVTINDNNTPRSLINTLGSAVLGLRLG